MATLTDKPIFEIVERYKSYKENNVEGSLECFVRIEVQQKVGLFYLKQFLTRHIGLESKGASKMIAKYSFKRT